MSTTGVDGAVKREWVYISTKLDCLCDERFNGTEKSVKFALFLLRNKVRLAQSRRLATH